MRAKLQAALLLGTAVAAIAPAHAALVISKGQTSGVSCSGGICNATSVDAVLNNKDLTNMLAAGDVKVFAEGVATDITVAATVTWASSHTLTLGAYGSINVKDTITVKGTSGLTLTANVAQTGGVFRLVGTGKISFWDTASALVINGTSYTLISNLPMLISAIASNPSGTYALSNDYNAAGDGSYPHSPIPTTFNGIFEGLGNAISNFSIYNTNGNLEKIALFSEVGPSGQLSDVNLPNVAITSVFNEVAPLVALNNGTVSHSSATGTISSVNSNYNDDSAGLVRLNAGTITRSHASVNITGTHYAGGLVTYNQGTISLSDASGSVSAWGAAAGLAEGSSGNITDSSAYGNVTVETSLNGHAGGLVAYLDSGTIQRCFVTGAVEVNETATKGKRDIRESMPRSKSGESIVGGIAAVSRGTIAYSYATGSVKVIRGSATKPPSLGGLIGLNSSNLYQSYAIGAVSMNRKGYLGGVIGYDNSPAGSNNLGLWDFDTTGVTNANQGAGNVFNDPGLKGYPEMNFRKAAMRKLDHSVWAQSPSINNGYPYLIANPPPQ